MFWAMFSPIIRSTWLYLQYLVVFTQVAAAGVLDELKLNYVACEVCKFTQVAAGWCLRWVETELCGLWGVYTHLTNHKVQFQLI
jgi:hypothetical protein